MSTSHEEKKEDSPVPMVLPAFRPSNQSLEQLTGRVIGSTNLHGESAACPCCKQQLGETRSTLNEPATQHQPNSRVSLLSNESMDEDDEDLLPGVLAEGQGYSPKRILVQGWLHKKGTGHDWLGSRAWKARWARLALAKVEGYDSEVPLLLIYWFPSSLTATTAIVLDSTVVLGAELDDKSKWNAYRFEVRHASTKQNGTIPVTRTFTADQKSRDAWVYAISEALLNYEKQKRKNRTSKPALCQPIWPTTKPAVGSPERPISPRFDEGWAGDCFGKGSSRPPSSPRAATSPLRSRQRMLVPPISPPMAKRVLNPRSIPRVGRPVAKAMAEESLA